MCHCHPPPVPQFPLLGPSPTVQMGTLCGLQVISFQTRRAMHQRQRGPPFWSTPQMRQPRPLGTSRISVDCPPALEGLGPRSGQGPRPPQPEPEILGPAARPPALRSRALPPRECSCGVAHQQTVWRAPRPVLDGGWGGSGTQKFVYQKWPKESSPFVKFFFFPTQ